jgi:hypothetical protein
MSTKSTTKIKREEEITHTTMELQYTYISRRVVEVTALTRILDQLMRHISSNFRHATDEWIGRNILKIESELEYNNPKHWTAKRILPFQG